MNPDGTTVIVAGSGTKGSLDGRGVSAQVGSAAAVQIRLHAWKRLRANVRLGCA